MSNEKNTTLKSYKGFNKDLKCRDFQYEVGKEYETDRAILCEEGFHACTDPLAVWDYYYPCDNHRFCEVEQGGEIAKEESTSKVTTRRSVQAVTPRRSVQAVTTRRSTARARELLLQTSDTTASSRQKKDRG